jgi:hypothetical protein
MFAVYEKLSGRAVRVKNKTRVGHIRAQLKNFTEEELEIAFRAMAKDVSLRGDNKSGVDYFSIEYATRVQNIERYLEIGKRAVRVSEGRPASETAAKAEEEFPPLKITRPDGTVVLEYPDGRCVVQSPATT